MAGAAQHPQHGLHAAAARLQGWATSCACAPPAMGTAMPACTLTLSLSLSLSRRQHLRSGMASHPAVRAQHHHPCMPVYSINPPEVRHVVHPAVQVPDVVRDAAQLRVQLAQPPLKLGADACGGRGVRGVERGTDWLFQEKSAVTCRRRLKLEAGGAGPPLAGVRALRCSSGSTTHCTLPAAAQRCPRPRCWLLMRTIDRPVHAIAARGQGGDGAALGASMGHKEASNTCGCAHSLIRTASPPPRALTSPQTCGWSCWAWAASALSCGAPGAAGQERRARRQQAAAAAAAAAAAEQAAVLGPGSAAASRGRPRAASPCCLRLPTEP